MGQRVRTMTDNSSGRGGKAMAAQPSPARFLGRSGYMQRHIRLDPERYPLHEAIISAKAKAMKNAEPVSGAATAGTGAEPAAAVSVSRILSVAGPASSEGSSAIASYGKREPGQPAPFSPPTPTAEPVAIDSGPESDDGFEALGDADLVSSEGISGFDQLPEGEITVEQEPPGDELPAVFGFRVLAFHSSLEESFSLSESAPRLIGPDDDCDIRDSAVLIRHSIVVKGKKAFISSDSSQDIYIDGVPATGSGWVELPSGRPVRIGDTRFTVSPSVTLGGAMLDSFDLVSCEASESLVFFEADQLLIGDDGRCDVVIPRIDSTPDSRASIFVHNGRPFFHAESSEVDVKLNGLVLSTDSSGELGSRDRITIGRTDLDVIYFAGDRRQHSDMGGMAVVITVHGGDGSVADEIAIGPGKAGALIFGRGGQTGNPESKDGCLFVPVEGKTVSREHALLTFDEKNRPVLHNLGAYNGTLVNGKPFKGGRALNDGDVVQLGEATLTVSSHDYRGAQTAKAIEPAWVRFFSRFAYLQEDVPGIRGSFVSMEARIRSSGNLRNTAAFLEVWEGCIMDELALLSHLGNDAREERARRCSAFVRGMERFVEKACSSESPERFMHLISTAPNIGMLSTIIEKYGGPTISASIKANKKLIAAISKEKIYKKPEGQRWAALFSRIPEDILGHELKSKALYGLSGGAGLGSALGEMNRLLLPHGLLVMNHEGSPVIAKAIHKMSGQGLDAVFVSAIDGSRDAFGIAKMGDWMFFGPGGFLVVADRGSDNSVMYSFALQQHMHALLGVKSAALMQLSAHAAICISSSCKNGDIIRYLELLGRHKDKDASSAGKMLLSGIRLHQPTRAPTGNGSLIRDSIAESLDAAYKEELGVRYSELFGNPACMQAGGHKLPRSLLSR